MSRDVIALPMAAADVYIVGGGMSEDLRIIGSASLIGGSPVPETVPPSNC
ncbi:MAG: hypothetical protein JWO56_2343 [Acidobacteria bacterium]|nr:hypothetical protein [Acidobacteriota bacterium]